MGKFYIINSPWGFSTAWSLVKGWLDEATVAKIHILSSDYKKVLLEQVPAESLPSFLGGSCQCSEGCEMSDAGPWKDVGLKEKLAKEKKVKEDNDASLVNGGEVPAVGNGQSVQKA